MHALSATRAVGAESAQWAMRDAQSDQRNAFSLIRSQLFVIRKKRNILF